MSVSRLHCMRLRYTEPQESKAATILIRGFTTLCWIELVECLLRHFRRLKSESTKKVSSTFMKIIFCSSKCIIYLAYWNRSLRYRSEFAWKATLFTLLYLIPRSFLRTSRTRWFETLVPLTSSTSFTTAYAFQIPPTLFVNNDAADLMVSTF